MRFCLLAGLAAAGVLALSRPASAQGIFESIFGRLLPHPMAEPPPSEVRSYAPSGNFLESVRPQQHEESGPATAFCVRTCDGHYFPVQPHPGLSAAQACQAFCPASKTRLYSGSSIDHAVAADGARYADLPAALLYRKQTVAGCTCDGHTAFGLAHIDVKADPTLKPGDVVVTRKGLVTVAAMKNHVAEFMPVESNSRMPKSYRDKLDAMRLMPPTPGEAHAATAKIPLTAKTRDDDRRSALRSP
jgi:hypothetical protein